MADLDLDLLLEDCDEDFIQILKEHLPSSSRNPEEQCNDREEVKFRARQHLIKSGCSAADIINFAFSVKQQDGNMGDKTVEVFDSSPEHEASNPVEKESVMGFGDEAVTIEGELVGKPEQKEGIMTEKKIGIISTEHGDSTPNGEEAYVVGIEDQADEIKIRLMSKKRRLDVISIVGMPGIGKTTLARKVYYDDYVADYFYIRAWIYVSQTYQKRDLLAAILRSPYIQFTSDLTDKDLSGELHKCLNRRRYLIVMDDIWGIGVWNELKESFPDDNNGSRILLTTRLKDSDLHAALKGPTHELRYLTEDESWDLLKEKVFHKESCPPELMKVGHVIAKKCMGLPLAIVVIAGVLAKEQRAEWWNQVAESVRSCIRSDRNQYMDTLALSYNHLPDHLKQCFLYFGAFPEDYEIPIWKLIWLWVAEGIIEKQGEKSLEDVAEDYLKDLIKRSLIIVANKRSDGGVKSCRIHDLLHDLCLRKAEEEGFLQRYDQVSSSSSSLRQRYDQVSSSSSSRRLSIHSDPLVYISSKPSAPDICSLLFFDSKWNDLPHEDSSFIYLAFSNLRVLDLWYIRTEIFPFGIQQLFHLRYLALRCNTEELPPELSNLCDLETFVFKGRKGQITLPKTIWTLTKLRHLHINESALLPSSIINGDFFKLNNLQTVSTLSFLGWTWSTLRNTPNLKKLGCTLSLYDGNEYKFPNLNFLEKLETLKMLYDGGVWKKTHLSELPSNLKKITLSKFHLPWSEMSKLARLHNLEVLKLLHNAFDGQWDTGHDDVFPKLKFLKFDSLNISQWNASRDHFPILERLVLNRCKKLEGIPFSFAEISTLQMIELNWSSKSAGESAREIEDGVKVMGNGGLLKILIYPRGDNSEVTPFV